MFLYYFLMRQNKSFFELVKADYKLVSKVSETWFVPSITNSKHNTRYITQLHTLEDRERLHYDHD